MVSWILLSSCTTPHPNCEFCIPLSGILGALTFWWGLFAPAYRVQQYSDVLMLLLYLLYIYVRTHMSCTHMGLSLGTCVLYSYEPELMGGSDLFGGLFASAAHSAGRTQMSCTRMSLSPWGALSLWPFWGLFASPAHSPGCEAHKRRLMADCQAGSCRPRTRTCVQDPAACAVEISHEQWTNILGGLVPTLWCWIEQSILGIQYPAMSHA